MEENKFEKQVQQRMDNLKLDPSDSVWENIKNRIEKRKDRKWGLLIFIFLFALMLSGGYWLYNLTGKSTSNKKEIANKSINQESSSSFASEKKAGDEKDKREKLALTEKKISNSERSNGDNVNDESNQTADRKRVKSEKR